MTSKNTTGSKATIAIVLVTSLFFIWGLTMNLVNALNSPFANYIELSSAEASLLQVAYYGAYFVMAIPAGLIAKRFGYKGGVISGLLLFALGAFMVIPATSMASYGLFLFAMFVIALGAASLETNCNPYITKLGDEKGESFRINMAQSFNGVGNIVGPLILGQILGTTVASGESGFDAAKTQFLNDTRTIYIVIGVVLVVVLAVFALFKLPTPPGDEEEAAGGASSEQLLLRPAQAPALRIGRACRVHFHRPASGRHGGLLRLRAQALGRGHHSRHRSDDAFRAFPAVHHRTLRHHPIDGQIRSREDSWRIHDHFSRADVRGIPWPGQGLRHRVHGGVSVHFHRIPDHILLTLKGIKGSAAKTGSSALVMSIVGAALIPLLLGVIQDAAGIEIAILVMVPGFLFVAWYAFRGSKIGLKEA